MKIYQELYDLKNYTLAETGYQCGISNREPSPEEYPFIRYMSDASQHWKINDKLSVPIIRLLCEIIVADENEIKGWEVYENWLKKIHQFNEHKGHKLLEDIEIEHESNTFIIRSVLELRMTVQNETN